jgi:hypothetical protein
VKGLAHVCHVMHDVCEAQCRRKACVKGSASSRKKHANIHYRPLASTICVLIYNLHYRLRHLHITTAQEHNTVPVSAGNIQDGTAGWARRGGCRGMAHTPAAPIDRWPARISTGNGGRRAKCG